MESENNISLESTSNGIGPKVVETIAKAFVDDEEEAHKHADSARTAKWSVPVNETIVERDIREQRERENAVASQRAAAALVRQEATNKQIPHDHNASRNEKNGRNSLIDNKGVSKSMVLVPASDTQVTLNLKKMPAQEEPKYLENTITTHKDTGILKTPGSTLRSFHGEKENAVENLCSLLSLQRNTKDSWQSDFSQNFDAAQGEVHGLDTSISAQTPDSDSNSPHDFHLSRSVLVKPLSEPEDDTSNYIRWQKETPIEREIRLAREREEELRREKGLPPLPLNNVVSTIRKSEVQKLANRRNVALNDCRSVQHRIATSRLQQEINEATEREKELHAAGLIQTISEDTVDSKVTRFTDLAGYAIEETERKLRRAVSASSVAVESENQSALASTPHNGQKAATFRPLFDSTPNNFNSNILTASKKFPPRVGHKGVMQRFLASHGKVIPVASHSRPNPFTGRPNPVSYGPALSPVLSSKDIGQKIDTTENEVLDSPRKNSRRGYMSAEERIQAELQEMQKREEELRLQRAQVFAQSQPNLLSLGDLEESDVNHDSEEIKRSVSGSSDSNFHLENSRDMNGDSSFPELSQWNSRKKSSLIAQWENRIQQNMHSEWEA